MNRFGSTGNHRPWQAALITLFIVVFCAAPGHTRGSGPSHELVLFDNWNGHVCSTTNRVRFELRRDSFVSRIVVWSDARRDSGNLSAILNGPKGAAGIASRQGRCDPHQRQWCERIFDVSLELSAGWYNLDMDRNSVCQNQGSRGNGFAKIYGNQR